MYIQPGLPRPAVGKRLFFFVFLAAGHCRGGAAEDSAGEMDVTYRLIVQSFEFHNTLKNKNN
jgi:hypothetical protein